VTGATRDPLTPAESAAVLAPLPRATPLPARVYWDEATLAHERRTIFERSWLVVGREDEVAAPGAWLRAPLTPEGIVVVRGADLALRAFYNVCRHRASLLVHAPCGRAQALTCPYHGWTYALTGALADAPHAPADFDRAAHGLRPVNVGVWQGFVLVTLDDDAPSLAASLGAVPPWLAATPLSHLVRLHRAEAEAAANWKLVAENFQESHHFTRVHPALERLSPTARARSVLGDGPWLGGTMELADGVETVSLSGTRAGRPFVGAPRRDVNDALLFPALLTSLQPDYLLTYRLHPLAPDRTRIVFDILVHPAAVGPSCDVHDLVGFWTRVNDEDRAICEGQQLGVGSRGYVPSCYSAVEDGVHAFDRLVVRSYAR
jgi:glycine betaine catabolism A